MDHPLTAVALLLALLAFVAYWVWIFRVAIRNAEDRGQALQAARAYWRQKGISPKGLGAVVALALSLSLAGCASTNVNKSARDLIRLQAKTHVKVRRDYLSGAALGDLALKSRVNRLSAQITAAELVLGEDVDGNGRVGE